MEQSQPKVVTIAEAAAAHRSSGLDLANKVNQLVSGVVDVWVNNFTNMEKVVQHRNEQVNFLMKLYNDIAVNGFQQLNELGQKIEDPEISSKVLEAHNNLMAFCKNTVELIAKNEAEFNQKMTQAKQQPQTNVQGKEEK